MTSPHALAVAFYLQMSLAVALLGGCAEVKLNPFGKPYSSQNTFTQHPLSGCGRNGYDTPPILTYGSKPLYPIGSLISRKTGEALIVFSVSEAGVVTVAQTQTEESKWFVEHAKLAMTDWKVEPAQLQGKSVAVKCRIVFDYRI
jgi:outer membrane biosynthesis protein TonB